jgi:membrane-associated phospholipid phosphatase
VPSGPSTNGLAFQLADWINLTYNSLPSLHVGMAVVCAYSYGRLTSPAAALGWWAWATAIALSTLLTHQHYVVDVATGGALGFIVAVSAKSRRIDVGLRHQD